MGRGSITLYIMIIAGMGIVLSGWWYRNIWFKVEEAIEIYVNVFWICVCLLAALSIYGWRMHELLDTCNRTMEIQEGVIKDVVLIDTVTQYDDFDIYEVTLYGRERPIEKVVSGIGLKKGMHVRIDAYRSSFYGTLVSRIDGKTPEYYKKIMEHKNKKELRIRSCLTGAIWLALAFSMLISALLFAFLNHFLDLPGKIPGLGWLLIFNTLIAGLITSFINAKLLEPITRLSKAMKAVSQGDFEQHLETNSRIDEIGESYQSFNVMTKELRATEMLQMDFVSNVSHEFKTPINAIEGYTMLLQGDELSQEQEGYVEKILFNTQRLSGLVGNILLLSRLENQNIPMKKTKYRLDEQIRQAFLALEDKWTEKGIGFQVEMEEVRYVGNEGLFMHIWMNLLDNAIKFSPENGTITMFLRHENDSVQFILEDEGPGIADDAKARIFDKFYQVDGSHKAEGNGLGLALVKRIVDIAGGTIKAENREYGGCRFVVQLPIKNYNE